MTDFLNDIDRALDTNDVHGAAAIASQALAKGVRAPVVLNLVAWQFEEEGRFAEAEAVLRDALKAEPSDPTLHVALGIVRRKQGHLKEAVTHFEKAIALDPSYAAAWFERGSSFEKGGAANDAIDDYRQSIALDPQNGAAHAALAASLARKGETDIARQHAQLAMRLEPTNVAARNALAQIALEERRPADAVALLEPVRGAETETAELLVSTRTLLGDAYHGVGRFDDAHGAYVSAQKLFHDIHHSRLEEGKQGAIGLLQRVEQSFRSADKQFWASPSKAPTPVGQHVILTGYPRSGTTLVENILATLPASLAIEERPTLSATDRQHFSVPEGLENFLKLDEDGLNALRNDYWQRVRQAAGADLAGKLFVDMDPFKGPRLPFIAKLFPGAKIIIVRRDPRDVVWSCFHTSFAFNAGTMAFSTLESTAQHYALTWSIIEESLAALSIDHFNLRYDKLVGEFDDTTRQLCAFLGVEWSEDLRQFDKTAQRRGVSTASATQVRKGLYNGSGSWEPYAAYMKQVEPILAPWVERFNNG